MTALMEAPTTKTAPSVIGVSTILEYVDANPDKVFFDEPIKYAERCVLTDYARDVLGYERATYMADGYIYHDMTTEKRKVTEKLASVVSDLDIETGFMGSYMETGIKSMTGREIAEFIRR
jgi:hypothetical protein